MLSLHFQIQPFLKKKSLENGAKLVTIPSDKKHINLKSSPMFHLLAKSTLFNRYSIILPHLASPAEFASDKEVRSG